jgi:hypothetical protein
MGDIRVISIADSVCISTYLPALHHTEVRTPSKILDSFESPGRYSVPVAVIRLSHSSALNIPKILGVPTVKKLED